MELDSDEGGTSLRAESGCKKVSAEWALEHLPSDLSSTHKGSAKLLGITSFEGESKVMQLDLGSLKSETGVAQMKSCVTHSEVGVAWLVLVVAEPPFQTNLFFKGR